MGDVSLHLYLLVGCVYVYLCVVGFYFVCVFCEGEGGRGAILCTRSAIVPSNPLFQVHKSMFVNASPNLYSMPSDRVECEIWISSTPYCPINT